MAKNITYSNRYPEIDSLNLFPNRIEKSFIYEAKAFNSILANILKMFPGVKKKSNKIASTYFEKVLSYEPQKTCDVRFRQNITGGLSYSNIKFPKKWVFEGSGNLEIKIRDYYRRENAVKYASFLPDNGKTSIYTLIRLASKQNKNQIIRFLDNTNQLQIKNTKESRRDNLKLIPPEVIKNIYMYLAPFAARVNIRHTFEILNPQKARITLETNPLFYAYPISHLTHEHISFKKRFEAQLTEAPQKCKIDIKTKTKSFQNDIIKSVLSNVKPHVIQDNQYSSLPYYKMVLSESKRKNVVINERPGHEVETKANILEQIKISDLIYKIRNELLINNSPYKLFATEPHVSTRNKMELNRTVIGRVDRNNIPHEVVTIIRLTSNANEKHGFSTVLKWKTDNKLQNPRLMKRKEKIELLKTDLDNSTILKKASKLTDKNLKIIGVFKKEKQRIVIQDSVGRNFVVSLDESRLQKVKSVLQQLEVEYAHTVKVGENHTMNNSVENSCIDCLEYFIKILKKLGVKTVKTNFRKIDFVAKYSL